MGILQTIAQSKVRNAARLVQKIQKRRTKWTVGETLSIIRKTGGVSVQVRLQETKRCLTNGAKKANTALFRKLFKTRLQDPWVLYRNCA